MKGPRASVVLLLATISSALTAPGQTIGVSVFIDSFVEDLGLTRSSVSTAYLVGTLTGATLLPAVGRFVDRQGVRRAQIVVGVLFALALLNMSHVNGLAWLAVGFVGIRLFGQGSLSLVSTVTVSLRFLDRRGTALGIFATVSSGLMALAPVVLAFSIARVGWRSTWQLAAVVVLVTIAPIAWFGLRDLPRGSARARAPEDAIGGTTDPAPAGDRSVDRTTALRTRSFWILASVAGSSGMLSTALNFHQIDLLGDAGLSRTAAAALFLPQVVGSSVAGLVVGYLSDRVGTKYLPAAGMVLLIAALGLAAVARPGAVVITYAVMLGAMAGTVRTATATLLPHWFGTRHLGSIQGTLTFFTVGSTAAGPVALAVLEQRFGSYPPAVLLLTALPAAALVFSLTRDRGSLARSGASSR